MIAYMRKKRILEELEKRDLLYIKALSLLFSDISISTIRRDLKELSEEGQIILLRGGAVKHNDNRLELPMETRKLMYVSQKDSIAKCAANLIEDGDTIYIDSGTTAGRIVNFIQSHHVTIVTSNMAILDSIKERDFNCIILGGNLRKQLDSIVGPLTDAMLANMHFNKAFMGASGFSLDGGYSTPSFQEGSKKHMAIKNSDITYMLVDDSKAGKNTICKIASIEACTIITNNKSSILENIDNYIIAK